MTPTKTTKLPRLTGKIELQLGRHTFIRIRHSERDDRERARELRAAVAQLRYAAGEFEKLAAGIEAKARDGADAGEASS